MPQIYYTADQRIVLSATSPAAPGTAAGTYVGDNSANGLQFGLARFEAIAIEADLVGASGGTLDVYLQVSHNYNPFNANESATWTDYVHFAQLAAAASAISYRVDPALTNSITVVGHATTPALAAGICAGGFWGDAMRLLFVAGASTSAGATISVVIAGKQRNVRP